MAKFIVTSIDWETDGEEVSLPTEEIVDGVDNEDAAVDALSDKYMVLLEMVTHLRGWMLTKLLTVKIRISLVPCLPIIKSSTV